MDLWDLFEIRLRNRTKNFSIPKYATHKTIQGKEEEEEEVETEESVCENTSLIFGGFHNIIIIIAW